MRSPGPALAGLVSPWCSISQSSITPHLFTPHSEKPPCSSPTNHEAKHTEQPPAWTHTSGIHCSYRHSPILVIVQVPQVAAHFHVPLKKKKNNKRNHRMKTRRPRAPSTRSLGAAPAETRRWRHSRPAWPGCGGRS